MKLFDRILIVIVCSLNGILVTTTNAEHRAYDLPDEIPGHFYMDLAIDSRGQIFLATYDLHPPDPSTMDSEAALSSSLMRVSMDGYLSRYDPQADAFETVISDFPGAEQILFDSDDNLWIRTGKTVIRRSDAGEEMILDLQDKEGLFRSMAIDGTNNVWVGGLKTGLYRIGPDSRWTHYTSENSSLPSNSMTSVHFAGPEDLWVAMWYNIGVWHGKSVELVKPKKLEGTVHDARGTQVPLQTVWTIVSDTKGHLWFGSGSFQNQPASLVRFDGKSWVNENLADECTEPIRGSVRRLAWDGTKLWVLANLGTGTGPRRNCLATLADGKWSPVQEISPDADVLDIEADPRQRRVWIATIETEKRRTRLHRFSY